MAISNTFHELETTEELHFSKFAVLNTMVLAVQVDENNHLDLKDIVGGRSDPNRVPGVAFTISNGRHRVKVRYGDYILAFSTGLYTSAMFVPIPRNQFELITIPFPHRERWPGAHSV